MLRQLSTNSGSNDDDNGGGKPDARCTSNMKARNSSHSMDRCGSIHTDNSRIRNPGSRFQWKSEHQNAARERKPIRLPPMQSREAFSYSFLPRHEFYSYEAKYLDENGAVLQTPAKLSSETSERVRQLAIKTFTVLCCEGIARVDFFLRNGEEIVVNEINTMPGFTRISMYPKLWEATGISYSELIDTLIQLALERFQREQRLKTDRA